MAWTQSALFLSHIQAATPGSLCATCPKSSDAFRDCAALWLAVPTKNSVLIEPVEFERRQL